MNKLKTLRTPYYMLLCMFILWGLVWLSVGAYYSFPNAEDLSVSVVPKENNGFLLSIFYTLKNYDGRYFTNVLHAINPLVYDSLVGYKLMPILAYSLFSLSIFFLIRSLFRKFELALSIIWSLIFGLLPIILAPSISHLLYWMISSFVYLYAWSFYLLWLVSSIQYFRAVKQSSKNIWFTISAVLLICAVGINEMFLPLISLTLLLFAFYSVKKKMLSSYLPLLFIGACSIYLFINSPGIEVRMESMTTTRDIRYFVDVFIESSKHLLFYAVKWLFLNPFVIPLSLLFYFQLSQESLDKIRSIRPLYIILFVGALLSMLIPFYIGMGAKDIWPQRIYSCFFIGFFGITLLSLIYIIERFGAIKKLVNVMRLNYIQFALAGLMVLSLFSFNNNVKLIYTEYRTNLLQDYSNEMSARYSAIDKVKNSNLEESIVTTPYLQNRPASIFNKPDIALNREKELWNEAYEQYFEIDQIKLEEDESAAYLFKYWYENYKE